METLGEVSKRLSKGPFIRNPANPSENLNRLDEKQWETFTIGIEAFLGIAQDACIAQAQLEAADQWAKAFEHFFPMPEATESLLDESLAKAQLPTVINLPDVVVSAQSSNNKNLTWSGTNQIGPIPKGCDITFKVAEPWKLPPGTEISWVVRNEGAEAEGVNDLGHAGSTGYLAVERSAYTGNHYMDCIIRQSGRAIGVRRIPVKISGTYVPPRNPIKKPAYTRLLGRR